MMVNTRSTTRKLQAMYHGLGVIQTTVRKELKEFTLVQINFYLEDITQRALHIKTAFEDLLDICSDEDYDKHLVEFQEKENIIRELKLDLLKAKEELTSHGGQEYNVTSNITPAAEVRLPKLELPIFSGCLSEWLSFRDQFIASVQNNAQLSSVQKLQYLRSSVRGQALKIIQGIALTNDNYAIAWDLLVERYSNTKELVYTHLGKLLSMPIIHVPSSSLLLEFVDTIHENTRALKILNQNIEEFSETMLVFILQQKLDKDTMSWWERSLSGDKLPALQEFTDFLKNHARTLTTSKASTSYKLSHSVNFAKPKARITTLTGSIQNSCVVCNAQHKLFQCPEFIRVPVEKKVDIIKSHNVCFNCLGSNHRVQNCRQSQSCKKCGKRHHTLIHFEYDNTKNQNKIRDHAGNTNVKSSFQKIFTNKAVVEQVSPRKEVKKSDIQLTSCVSTNNKQQQILLSTALICVTTSSGDTQICRALIDSGSQANFITEECVQRLGLSRKHSNLCVSSLGASKPQNTRGMVNLEFSPHFNQNKIMHESAYILKRITGNLPTIKCMSEYSHLQDLVLADPTFNCPGTIDILFGVSMSMPLFKGNVRYGKKGEPFAVESELGWLMAGPCVLHEKSSAVHENQDELPNQISIHLLQTNTDDLVRQFWEIETIQSSSEVLSEEEQACEKHFSETHTRDQTGRYIVRLPFKRSPIYLGHSRYMAINRFEKLENRFAHHQELAKQYSKFMQEYLEWHHMRKIEAGEVMSSTHYPYYLPHHAVFREGSSTTKLRVVFDASAKSSSNLSLNDILMVGPIVQQSLFAILLRFRTHPIAISGDIEKMYRQIKIHEADSDLQRIVWRSSRENPLEEYKLITVTYGTAAAPFLATRVLLQLANDEAERFPLASTVLKSDFYVDDMLSGARDVKEAISLLEQMQNLLHRGGFELHKISSSDTKVLSNIPEHLQEIKPSIIGEEKQVIKILGVSWVPSSDNFIINVKPSKIHEILTKRTMLAQIASIFDPYGWLAPSTICAKVMLQDLWRSSKSWDDPINNIIHHKWQMLMHNWRRVESIQIPRYIFTYNPSKIQLHGFSDASEKAYCAAIYVRSVSKNSELKVCLLTAKTRVAPLKSISLPRLELCAAVLLVRLLNAVRVSFQATYPIFAYTDSTIVLSWLSSSPKRWQTFVANRVSEIQQSLSINQWHHVSSYENPADCGTRGILPTQLINCSLWWNGPQFLNQVQLVLPSESINLNQEALSEEKRGELVVAFHSNNQVDPFWERYSSYSKLIRVIAWCMRFYHNTKVPLSEKHTGCLSSHEYQNAIICLVKVVQASEFSEEVKCFKKGKLLSNSSKLLSLNPFLDPEGVIRVGGRLSNAKISEDKRHPILLPRKHHVTNLLVRYYHIIYLHAGPQLLLSIIRSKFWILCGRDVVRRIVKQCVTCCKQQAKAIHQLMADLPAIRVIPTHPFHTCGVDFAGPFQVKLFPGKTSRFSKCYVALFICLTTKAIHLELVSDLTSCAFLAALRRFVSRRGKPLTIMSDCGTNFVGANRELKELSNFITSIRKDSRVTQFTTSEDINWHFNPPASPHFGGLWEAGVKSMKYHLKRVVGNHLLTSEEFVTLLTQIEACLNSRPLCPMSSDPNDFSALTPGHFLIGGPLLSLPDRDHSTVKLCHLKHWRLIQALLQHFWKRWNTEFLSRLQQRPKWMQIQPNIKINDLVIIKEDTTSPLQWKLGRVIAVHPGRDNLIRVATVKTVAGVYKRPITKLCLLPECSDHHCSHL